jgi:hypothetical protein
MPHKRFHDVQNDGERLRQRKEKLKTHCRIYGDGRRVVIQARL